MATPENTPVTVESLSEKIESTKTQLQELKQSIESLTKSQKTEYVKNHQEVENIQEIKEMKETIETIKAELNELKNSLPSGDTSTQTIENDLTSIEIEYQSLMDGLAKELEQLSTEVSTSQEEKGWWRRQFDGLFSKEEWKNNTATNILRTIAGGGIIGGGIWVVDKITNKIRDRIYKNKISGYENLSRKAKKEAREKYKQEKKETRKKEIEETGEKVKEIVENPPRWMKLLGLGG